MKLRPNDKSELTRLKRLDADARAEIFNLAFPPEGQAALSNAEIRKRIYERWNIRLARDGQLSQFWPWQQKQSALDYLGAMMSDDEQDLQDKFPNTSREKIRETVIKRGYAIANLSNDVSLGLKVLSADLKEGKERRDWERFWDGKKSKIEAGLDELAGLLKKHPDLLKEYQAWREKFSERTLQ